LNSDLGEAMINCDPNGPLIICLSKVQADKHQLIATGRIFSGSCSKKEQVFLLREKSYETIQRTAIFMGQRREQVDSVPVGNIVAIEGLKQLKSGETIVNPDYTNKMIPFENVRYVSTPVVTISIEPEFLRDIEKMKELVENLLIEDPNLKFEINEDNGEFLLSGMGPLHLEVTANEIEKRGVKVTVSEPRAVYKESCRSFSSQISVKSPNYQNYLKMRVARLDEKTIRFLQSIDINTIKPISKLKNLIKERTTLKEEEIEYIWKVDENLNMLIFEANGVYNEFEKNTILEVIEKMQLNGPLCGEKLTEIKLIVEELEISEKDDEVLFTDLASMFYDAFKRALNEAELVLLEPIYHTIIQLPPDYIKNTLSLLSKYSAKVKTINQDKDYQATIEILIPVRNSIKFAEDIRSATSGRAFWQNEFYAFLEVPDHEAKTVIDNLKFTKGLSW
ncbi:MAG: hypothetical protein EAX89_09220, partial [Candidatus Lokiarchaeota archaeon]|nr:hypothetical protein [Candidatus Lokiarchaeota archaeon]